VSDPAVIKLGGSYASSAQLPHWLDAIERCAGHAILVPGGGPFADAVRTAQAAIGFDDRAAHRMALLAMEQYGLALASSRPRFRLANSAAQIRSTLAQRKVPVWSPARMALAVKDLPASWELTSDSLAAWLAKRLRLGRLLLVKHFSPPPDGLSAEKLAAAGIVDPLFPRFLGASGTIAYIAGPADHVGAAEAIRRGGIPGSRIELIVGA
jgi:5-(aminomethyl)-3-furanmethanol phosphate kinase